MFYKSVQILSLRECLVNDHQIFSQNNHRIHKYTGFMDEEISNKLDGGLFPIQVYGIHITLITGFDHSKTFCATIDAFLF